MNCRARFCLALLSVVAVGTGCRVKAPGSLENQIASTVKQDFTVGGKKDVNPFPPTEENVHDGQRAFRSYCFACHGLDGQNTGVPFADRMAPPVPSLASKDVQGFKDGQLKWIIENGIYPSGMPASKGMLSDEEMWKIVLYVRHLPAKGSLGEPAMYNGDPEVQPPGKDNAKTR